MADYIMIGGHGKVAMRTTPRLIEEGHTVTAVIRKAEQVQEVEAVGAKALLLDIETATVNDFADAFRGKDGVIWAAGAGGGDPQRTYAVDRDAAQRSIDAAVQAGVDRYVMVSYAGAGPDHGVGEDHSFFPYAESKSAADAHLRESGLKYTILGPGMLTLDDPTFKISLAPETGSAQSAEGGRDTSRSNVAEAIVVAVEEDATIGQTIDFYDGDTAIRELFRSL